MKLECASCGATYPGDLQKSWGRTKQTNGYGGRMSCVALVDGDGPLAPDGSKPQQVCGGQLGAINDNQADSARLVTLEPITAGDRP